MMPAPLEINWYNLYRNRQELDRRWSNYPGAGLSADLSDDTPLEEKETPRAYEPKVTRISGHGDRCASLRVHVYHVIERRLTAFSSFISQRILLRVRLVTHRHWLSRPNDQGVEPEDGQVSRDFRGPPRLRLVPQVRPRLGHP